MAGFIWPVAQGAETAGWIARWLDAPAPLALFLKGQFAAMASFLIYQIVFWNIVWKNKPVLKL